MDHLPMKIGIQILGVNQWFTKLPCRCTAVTVGGLEAEEQMKEHSPEMVCSEIVVTCLLFHPTPACDAVVTVDGVGVEERQETRYLTRSRGIAPPFAK